MVLNRTGVTALMIADPGTGTNMFCKPNGTTSSNVSLVNGSSFTVDVAFSGGYLGDPATMGVTYRFALPPTDRRAFSVTPGSYESSGQTLDGMAVLEQAGWVFSRGCDFALAICVLNNNRACRLPSGVASEHVSSQLEPWLARRPAERGVMGHMGPHGGNDAAFSGLRSPLNTAILPRASGLPTM